ncbi:MAG: PKD domain-containing protein [candidate division Zixibacteria bacterium]|nr:PKD domain-containing protein [candidate division Zixibacteria bacterium]MDD5426723.1 PKD domain-containing protein [candidate division Zixibacteria bacterium]
MFRVLIIGLLLILVCLPPSGSAADIFDGPESVAFDSITNRYFISNYRDGSIVQIDQYGDTGYFKTGLGHCYGNCIKDNILYVSTDNRFKGFDVTTGQEIYDLYIAIPSRNLDGVTYDTSGYFYALCTGGVIYRIDLNEMTYETLVNNGLPNHPQDIIFDKFNNRLLVASYESGSDIMQVSLPDGTLSTAGATVTGLFDGINIDYNGYIYLASHYPPGMVYRYNNDFTIDPELIKNNYNQPAGLEYNLRDDIVAVPVFGSNEVDFIHLYVDFQADTLWGYAPLEVTFTAANGVLTSAAGAGWDWSFGDGETGEGQMINHTYQNPGAYEVTVTIDPTEGDNHSYTRYDYIIVLDDSLMGSDIQVETDTFEVALDLVNNMPLKGLVLPCEFSGEMEVNFLGYSVESTRAEIFNSVSYLDFDLANNRFTLNFENLPGIYLSAGSGPVINLRFEIVAADSGDAMVLTMTGYDSYNPVFHGALTDYVPGLKTGTVTYIKTGCCEGVTGDADCSDNEPDISDITRLISFLYLQGSELCCVAEADVDTSGGSNPTVSDVDIADITFLIAHLYLDGRALKPCP